MRRLMVALFLLVLAPLALQAQPGRAIKLQATRNTRDVGGLPVSDGTVRKGMLYRSGALCFLTGQDVSRMRELKLKTILDLRNSSEIRKDGPDRPALTEGVRVLHLPMANSRGLRREAYHYYIRENPHVWRGFYAELARVQAYPMLFHCSAGKDRTGILTAVLLEQLGAERRVVLDDYLQSVRNSPGLEVHPEWIQEVFDYVDASGGASAFLVKNGVSLQTQQAARDILVERKVP